MQTSINLQEPFTYSILPIIIITILILLVALCLLISKMVKKETEDITEVKEIPEKNIKNVPVIKGKYLHELDTIEYKYNNDMIDLRKAYQLISEAVRLFVFEITDITTQNYSLTEIRKLNMPELYELIKEYYEPEFASKSKGDLNNSIDKARRIIKEWK